MKKIYLLGLMSLLLMASLEYSCKKEEPVDLSVMEKLAGTWRGDSTSVEVALNGMSIDSLSQKIATDTISLVLNADSSYELFVGNVGYKGKFSLKHNDSEIVIDDFGELLSSYLPDSIDANIQQQIFIEELSEAKLSLNGLTFANVVVSDVPLQVQLTSLSYFHKEN